MPDPARGRPAESPGGHPAIRPQALCQQGVGVPGRRLGQWGAAGLGNRHSGLHDGLHSGMFTGGGGGSSAGITPLFASSRARSSTAFTSHMPSGSPALAALAVISCRVAIGTALMVIWAFLNLGHGQNLSW